MGSYLLVRPIGAGIILTAILAAIAALLLKDVRNFDQALGGVMILIGIVAFGYATFFRFPFQVSVNNQGVTLKAPFKTVKIEGSRLSAIICREGSSTEIHLQTSQGRKYWIPVLNKKLTKRIKEEIENTFSLTRDY